jgi:hypothetical protein
MEFIQILGNAGIAALINMFLSLFPLGAGAAYLLKPTEQRLALMRPLSLVGLFSGLNGTTLGAINTLRMVWNRQDVDRRIFAVASAESLVPLFLAFGALTMAWLFVAIGMRRHAG